MLNFLKKLREDVEDAAPDDMSVVVSLASVAEVNGTFAASEEGVVLAHADILAGHDRGAALTDDDFAGRYLLAVTSFDAKIFWIRVS